MITLSSRSSSKFGIFTFLCIAPMLPRQASSHPPLIMTTFCTDRPRILYAILRTICLTRLLSSPKQPSAQQAVPVKPPQPLRPRPPFLSCHLTILTSLRLVQDGPSSAIATSSYPTPPRPASQNLPTITSSAGSVVTPSVADTSPDSSLAKSIFRSPSGTNDLPRLDEGTAGNQTELIHQGQSDLPAADIVTDDLRTRNGDSSQNPVWPLFGLNKSQSDMLPGHATPAVAIVSLSVFVFLRKTRTGCISCKSGVYDVETPRP